MGEGKEIMVTVGLKGVQGGVSIATFEDGEALAEKLRKAMECGAQAVIEGTDGQSLLLAGSSISFVKIEPNARPMMGYMRSR